MSGVGSLQVTTGSHAESTHASAAPHAVPQAPQFASSLVVSTHAPPHWV